MIRAPGALASIRAIFFLTLGSMALLLAGCGGGSASAPADTAASTAQAAPNSGAGTPGNVATVVVDGGTDGQAVNEPFVTVTLCQPGTNTCQSIDHVLLDTGSSGLRVLASALTSVQLPAISASGGTQLAECAGFASGYSWGSVRRADVRVAGETAAGIPVEVVNDASAPYATVPASCRNQGGNMGTGASANGILGIGLQIQDCGPACASNPQVGIYYACAGLNQCSTGTAPLSSQVANPVAAFANDNNGVAIAFPAVAPPGVATVSGTLTFGIGTQSDNALANATVYTTDASGAIGTTYKGTQMSSFFDTGSNGYFFPDPSLRACAYGFYCPAGTVQLQAQVEGANAATATVDFTIEPFTSVTSTITAAPIAGDPATPRTFDWGMPFFYGRTVYVAFAGASTPAGAGPYWAF